MYIINKEANRIEKIETAPFRQLGFREVEYLQEWIETANLEKGVSFIILIGSF
jgi:hypothetical protein